jgi:bifunctional UDP-N-acetylglucosamine pyrophosphorylase/glucosamine-1-phosphate N-acetyltransferase
MIGPSTSAVVLAAGKGTRMKSELPKVLHELAGRPLVEYPVRAALEAGVGDVIVVVGHGREAVEAHLSKVFGAKVKTAVQREQLGTGDAARAGLEAVTGAHVLLFYGDVPLLEADDLAKVTGAVADTEEAVGLATCVVEDPTGYGRILRDAMGEITEIREHKDLRTDAERAVREINPGIFRARTSLLRELLRALRPNNAQGELYLTDVIALARRRGARIVGVPSRAEVLVGINDRAQLADAEARLYRRIADRWRKEGVTVRDGARIDAAVVLEPDATVEAFAVLRGQTRVGAGARVDVGCVLTDVVVDAGAVLKPYTVAQSSRIGARAQVGPFSHLRPESEIGEDAHVGNFVETKKTRLGKGAKANHLAYLGDGIVGARANVGAGTIFCNYDGFQKHTTVIEDDAFIGSDSQLVAPVRVGAGAYVATGTTVTKDVPADALAISRPRQENKEGYASRLKARMKAAKDAAAQKK